MKQVVQIPKTGDVRVEDVPPPRLRAGGALVLTRASLISAGTERSKIALGKAGLVGKARARPDLARQVIDKARQDGVLETYRTVATRLKAPTRLGYSACGVVLETAPDCSSVTPGELVACAGGGYANHAEVNFVPQNLLARVPPGVTAAQAAYGTVGAIALHSLHRGRVGLGDRVAVIGLGLVGLLVVQLARAAGAHVFATDLDETACDRAGQLGADCVVGRTDSITAAATAFTDGQGVDVAIICAATPSSEPVDLASALCRDRGRVVVVGDVGLQVPRAPFYEKELDLRLSRSYGPGRYDPSYEEHGHDYPIGYVRWTEQRNLAEFLRLVEKKLVDVDVLTTHRFPVEQAAEAYALVAGRADDRPVGVLLEYRAGPAAATRTTIDVRPRRAATGAAPVGLGLIGAGSFATRVLLPALASDERVRLVGVCTASGASASQVAERFGFSHATNDVEGLLADPDVNAIVIATHHDSHASLTTSALRAGKAVFCEKPLATTWPELEEVTSAYRAADTPLAVGFNRRFSPLVTELRTALPPGVPRVFLCRVNAGPLPADHWVNDPIRGGGRVVGELCHFLDLACHFAERHPIRVSAERLGTDGTIGPPDSLIVQVAFADGSIGSIHYVSNGDPVFPKERIEVFCAGVVGVIDDFRSLEITRDGKRRSHKIRRQDKGHNQEMRAFIDAATGTTVFQFTESAFWSSALTLQVPVALSKGGPAPVDFPETLGGDDVGSLTA